MLRLVLLLFFSIAVKCETDILDASPAEILIENVNKYYETVGLSKGCVRKLPYNQNFAKKDFGVNGSAIRTAMSNFELARSDNETEFCNLTFGTVFPALKVINQTCQQYKLPDPLLNEAAFAVYYASHQLLRKHPDWFSCKDSKGKEVLGEIIRPEAYQPNYDITRGILARPLPKKSAYFGSSGKKLAAKGHLKKLSYDLF